MAYIGQINAYEILKRKHEGKRALDRRIRRRDDNIEIGQT
jgi:hypothetical protein